MNRAELRDAIIADLIKNGNSFHEAAIDLVLRAFESQVGKALEAGLDVRLMGFGIFDTKTIAAHPGHNPQNGKEVLVAEQRRVRFHAGAALRQRVDPR
jgi:nucleoid DNA-binding protein